MVYFCIMNIGHLLLCFLLLYSCQANQAIQSLPAGIESVYVHVEDQKTMKSYKGEVEQATDGSSTNVTLERVNVSGVSKKEEAYFHSLLSNGFPLTYLQYNEQNLPKELKAFGHQFHFVKKENHQLTYESKELDYMTHVLVLDYSITSFPRQYLNELVYLRKNPRSGREQFNQKWQFYGYQY